MKNFDSSSTTFQCFQRWMEANQMSISAVASALNVPYHRVYKIHERAHVPESFKWRFAQVFGIDEARIAFGEIGEPVPIVTKSQPVPEPA